MFDSHELCQRIIQPTLNQLGMYSVAAEKLLLGTAALHSSFNPLLVSKGLGLYQISPAQHRKVWDTYLAFRPELASKVRGFASQHQFLAAPDDELICNLAYGTAIAWMIYMMAGQPLPDAEDEASLLHYWQSVHGDNFGESVNCTPFTDCLKGYTAAA